MPWLTSPSIHPWRIAVVGDEVDGEVGVNSGGETIVGGEVGGAEEGEAEDGDGIETVRAIERSITAEDILLLETTSQTLI